MQRDTLNELLEWGRALEGFTRSHATDAVALVDGYIHGVEVEGRRVNGIGAPREDAALLLSIDIAWLLWLDDCFDQKPGPPIRWEELARSVDRPCDLVEAEGFARVRARMEEATTGEAEIRSWLESTIDVFRAYHQNELFGRGEKPFTYGEYLQNGETSIAAMQFLATISLVYGLAIGERMKDTRFRRMIRNLCLTMRLQNDLASADKERAQQYRANAVLVLEEHMPGSRATAFVLAERRGYERIMREDMDAILAPNDPVAGVIEVLLASTELYYAIPRERYAERPHLPAQAGLRGPPDDRRGRGALQAGVAQMVDLHEDAMLGRRRERAEVPHRG